MLEGIKKAPISLKPNYLLIPTTDFDITEEGAHEFNKILDYVKSLGYNRLDRTLSHGICRKKLRLPAFDVQASKYGVEIILLDIDGMSRIRFRSAIPTSDSGDSISGRKAFAAFNKHLKKYGIDLKAYSEEDGIKYKEEIKKPLIGLKRASMKDLTFTNVHHIDFHNSYPAGLANTHPEFRDAIEELYLKRKLDDGYKAILNLSVGFMQSQWCGYRYAQLARDAINDNYNRVCALSERLEHSGRVVLAYNTDGIWYQGEIYHGDGEGSKLGDWSNDHINCQWRAKSDGAYEFIEHGDYTPVVRGCQYNKYKDKSEWVWGDIYKKFGEVIQYYYTEGGIYRDGKKI